MQSKLPLLLSKSPPLARTNIPLTEETGTAETIIETIRREDGKEISSARTRIITRTVVVTGDVIRRKMFRIVRRRMIMMDGNVVNLSLLNFSNRTKRVIQSAVSI